MSTPTPAVTDAEPTEDPAVDPAEPTEVDDALDPDGDGNVDDDPEGADQLGDPGKKALASMKDKLKAEREKRRGLEAQLAELNKPAEGATPDPDALLRQAEQTAAARYNERIVRAEVKAAAAGKLADPADAYRFLDLSQFEVDGDGNVDADEVAEAIDDLIQSKPYLAAQGGSTKPRFQGTADSGARKGNARPTQLTEADVKRLSAAGKHAEIVKAQNEGRLDDYLGQTR
ncbi:hypothetical protein OG331_23050 [Streptomyces sp. NBC_01017]|uniref:phage scaffolding protein n=1 Tax=Streptomyces sp. NBC_01017 TaxID=2903721 RepID=UPI0038697709|nr:hypothetical protein OG331_23050 [Streptomyces sp. NBC_01017]